MEEVPRSGDKLGVNANSSFADDYCKQKDDDYQYVCKNGDKQGVNATFSCDEYCKQRDEDQECVCKIGCKQEIGASSSCDVRCEQKAYVCKDEDKEALDGLDRPNSFAMDGLDRPNPPALDGLDRAHPLALDEPNEEHNNRGNNQALHSSILSACNGDDELHGEIKEEGAESLSIDEVLRKWVAIACTPSSSLCSLPPSLWEWIKKDASTVSQWNLVCASSYMQGLAQSFFFIGCLLGAGIFGHLSDSRLGRRGALMLACMLNAACGMLTAASPSYWVYTFMRAVTGICSGGLGLTSFVLGTELIGPSRRTSVAMSALYFYPLGMLLLAGLATLTSHYNWRILYIVTSAPSVLYCLFILPFLAESPRWYLVHGRMQDALEALQAVAKINGSVVPGRIVLRMNEQDDDVEDNPHISNFIPQTHQKSDVILEGTELQKLGRGAPLIPVHKPPRSIVLRGFCCDSHRPGTDEANESCKVTNDAKKMQCKAASGTLIDVFRGNDTRLRMVILVVVWFASALGYYAFNLNVGNLGTNLTTSVVLNALAEVPGYAITACLLNRVGRRITLISALLLTACSSLVGATLSYKLNSYHTSNHFTYNVGALNQSTNYADATLNQISVLYNSALFDDAINASLPLNTSIPHAIPYHHIHNSQLRSSIQLACGLIGLFSIAGTYNLLYLYTTELFPTVVRNVALGLANQAGAVGSIMAPIVALSAHVNTSFPFFIIGVASLVGGILAINLPETLNRPFHETLEGMRRSASDQA
ncbi:hypothetical protein GOP47_0025646 [Adiantum capillus-veneris]|uniref:Major facilitator superfamily (MFS) profile domain-containing protein n=1 Tax=Adiantum capillus-veneris TaxID=13818 RepID=A0A9D4U122_ADICA|nr:hypothetical protein GOP47_0025646 [Adiantum capillus-veneris]